MKGFYIPFVLALVDSHNQLFGGTVEVDRSGVGDEHHRGDQEFQKRRSRRLGSVAARRNEYLPPGEALELEVGGELKLSFYQSVGGK